MSRYLRALQFLRLDIQQFHPTVNWNSIRELMVQTIQQNGAQIRNMWDGCISFDQHIPHNTAYLGDIGLFQRYSNDAGGQWAWHHIGSVFDDTTFEDVAGLLMKDDPELPAGGSYFFSKEELQVHLEIDPDLFMRNLNRCPPFKCHNHPSPPGPTAILDSPLRWLLW